MKMFGKEQAFYNGQIKKYTALFGALFADMHIVRGEGEVVKVPIRYANGSFRNKGDNGLLNKTPRAGNPVPAMAFELVNIAPDPLRKTNPYITVRSRGVDRNNPTTIDYTMNPTPHNLTYNLTIRTKTLDDAFQILEQIVAAFNPQLSIELIDSEDTQLTRDITIKLEQGGYNIDDNYAMTQDETRQIEITMEFTLMGYLYKKTQNGAMVLNTKFFGTIGDEDFPFGPVAATTEDLAVLAGLEQNANIQQGYKDLSDFAVKIDKGITQ